MRFARHLVILIASFLLVSPAFGWSKAGHMVTGSVAYDILARDNPEALKEIVRILKQHPSYTEYLRKRVESVPKKDRDRHLLMIAARWPDDIRGLDEYNHSAWHFINYPIVAKQDEGKLVPPAPKEENVVSAFESNLKILKESKNEGERAIAVCWILHLIGDAHQPLHTVSFFQSDYWPEGDWGGNGFFVRVTEDGEVINLHSLWDGILGNSAAYQDAYKAGVELRLRPEFSSDMLVELQQHPTMLEWANESRELALKVAYRNTTLIGSPTDANGPLLPDGYAAEAKAVSERRVLLAGYRIASVIENALKTPVEVKAN
ncbi:MAG TPA: S1/P1 nuclease [Tepidisphaeraceae bacterium]|nr:S1/P1 nuclease [Tepidisphaeraceae bacterium]